MEATEESQVEATQSQEGEVPTSQDAQPQDKPSNGMKDTPDWVPKRMGELAAARRDAEARALAELQKREQLEAELAQFRSGRAEPNQAGTPENVEQLARAYAQQMVRDQMQQQKITSRLSQIEETGKKELGEQFDMAVQNLTLAGISSPAFVEALTNVPNPEKVVTYLGQSANVGEAIRIASLDPVQLGIEMAKVSSRATKELGKQISKAPPPVGTIEGGSGGGADGAEPKMGTPEWYEWRNKNARRRR